MKPKFSLPERVRIVKRILKGEKVTRVSRDSGVSRTLIYKWLNRLSKSQLKIQLKTRGIVVRREKKGQKLTPIDLLKASQIKIDKQMLKDAVRPRKGRLSHRPHYDTALKIRAIQDSLKQQIPVRQVCRRANISPTIFYRWRSRYQKAGYTKAKIPFTKAVFSEHLAIKALENRQPSIYKYAGQVSAPLEKLILKTILENPRLSVTGLVKALPHVDGKPIVGHHGVQNVLRRQNLNTLAKRQSFSDRRGFSAGKIFSPIFNRVRSVFEKFTPQLAPAPPPVEPTMPAAAPAFKAKVPVPETTLTFELPSQISTKILLKFAISYLYKGIKYLYKLPLKQTSPLYSTLIAFSLVLVTGVFLNGLVSFGWLIFTAKSVSQAAGYIFSSLALLFGTFFFLYSLKYYLGTAFILLFSRQVLTGSNEGAARPVPTAPGLNTNVNQIQLTRHPFVSIHLPLYNEKRVVNRLLEAVTSMDYDNYEVIVCDDSTDETADMVREWQHHPRIKISHRESREGFKGGALREAVKLMDPRTEFVIVFDSDFLPFPETIEQFLKYFQTAAGSLDCSQLAVSSMQSETNTISANRPLPTANPNIAAVQGYQWHVLNKSENWITRGVRTEYAGSYIIERSAAEIYHGLKQIAGSVFMVRADILRQPEYQWSTSITEDFDLTLRLYRDGYKVVYTPYIQAPSECVSTVKRLVRQRMRWAEGHSYNIKKYFRQILFAGTRVQGLGSRGGENHGQLYPKPYTLNPNLTLSEKLEFLYLAPYYLQSAFFMAGTLFWFIAEAGFRVTLPFWTSVWGWSLVLTNMLSLPLMNLVGMFMEEAEEKDYVGLFSFVMLTYLVAPFQAYAAIKGFIEKTEGPWFRTPKTGKITDVFKKGRLFGWLKGLIAWGAPTPNIQTAVALRTLALPAEMKMSSSRKRQIGRGVLAILLTVSTLLTSYVPYVTFTSDNQGAPVPAAGHILSAKPQEHEPENLDKFSLVKPAYAAKQESVSRFAFKKEAAGLVLTGDNTNFRMIESPVFALEEHDGALKKLSQILKKEAPLKDRVGVKILNAQGQSLANVKIEVHEQSADRMEVNVDTGSLTPGKYTLWVQEGDRRGLIQDFTWGVLAINPNKSIYRPQETAKLAMGVLDETGRIVCDAILKLEVKSPAGFITTLTTVNGTIRVNPACRSRQFSLEPDYEANFRTTGVGDYFLTLTATTKNGTFIVDDAFAVANEIDFDVERITATRIYPKNDYPVVLKVVPKANYNGTVEDYVPAGFIIHSLTKAELADTYGLELDLDKGMLVYLGTQRAGDRQAVKFMVDWKAGETYYLAYEYNAPNRSPEFYLLGPAQIGEFKEARQWQIAVDADKVIFLTSGSSWTVPIDWTDTNTIEVIGAGGGGGNNAGGAGGGGGGAYSKIADLDLNYGGSAAYGVGTGGGAEQAGGDTWFNANTFALCTDAANCVSAKGGSGAATSGTGAGAGGTTAGIGDPGGEFAGGAGGAGSGTGADSGGGGGGAGSPAGTGGTGGTGDTSNPGEEPSGGGGGSGCDAIAGANDGVLGNDNGGNGGDSCTASGGTGGVDSAGNPGSAGSGGGGGDEPVDETNNDGGVGGDGTEWTGTDLSVKGVGGGGGGADDDDSTANGGNGGLYGGGGGGGYTAGSGANGLIVITYTPAPLLSGTVYTSEGGANIGANKTVDLRVNGAGTYTDETDANGLWEIYVPGLVSTNVITVYLDDEGTSEATTVMISDGTAKSDIHLYVGVVAVRHDTGTSIIPDNLYTGDDLDDDVKYIVSAASNGNLTVDPGFELHVWTGDTFDASGGTVTTQTASTGDLHVDTSAVATIDTGTSSIAGDVDVDGTLNLGASVNFGGATFVSAGTTAATAGTHTFTTTTAISGGGTINFYDLVTSGTGTLTLSSAASTDSDVSVGSGTTFKINANLDVNGGQLATVTSGIVTYDSGTPTVTITGTGNIGVSAGSGSITFYNLTTNGASATTTLQQALTVDNDVTIGSSHTLAMGANNVTVGGSWVSSGSFTASNWVTFTSTATNETITSGTGSFNNFKMDNGSKGYWKFDEGSGTNTTADHSGNSNTGTLGSTSGSDADDPTWTTSVNSASNYGNNPGSLDFDGSDDFVSVGNSTSLNFNGKSAVTVAAWVKPDSLGENSFGRVMDKRAAGNGYGILMTTTDEIGFTVDTATGDFREEYTNTSPFSSFGTWKHFVATYDGSDIKVYINGSEATTTVSSSGTGNMVDDGNTLYLGNRSANDRTFDGGIDDIRIYNRILSTTEISSLSGGSHPAAGTFTLQDALDANGDLSVRTGKLDVNSGNYGVAVGGNYTNVANFDGRAGTVTLNASSGTKTIQSDPAFYSLELSDGGGPTTFSLDKQRLDVNGNLTITGGTLDVTASGCWGGASCAINLAGNWTNNDTFTQRTGTVTLDGAADTTQTIDGNTTFYNLSASTGDRVIKFGAGDTFEIASGGTFTATGDSCTAFIMIRSTTATSAVNITKTGSISFTYVDVQDMNVSATGSTVTNSVDSGGNTNLSIAANACIGASNSTSNTATGYSFQRKTFYDATNTLYWLFYYDGSSIEVRSSTDGTSWTVENDHLNYNTNDFSVWNKTIGGTEYVFLAVTDATNFDIVVKRGTISGSNISWHASTEIPLNGTSSTDTYAYPYISMDSANHLWVMARFTGSSVYSIKTRDSVQAGDSTTPDWGSFTWNTASQISNDDASTNVFGNLVALATGDMYATMTVNTTIVGCLWDDDSGTGAWLDKDNNSCKPGASSTSYYFRNLGADNLTTSATAPRKEMNTTLGASTTTQTLDATNTSFYILTDNANKQWTSDKSPTTDTTAEKRNVDGATDSSGNTVAVWQDSRNSTSKGTFAVTGTMTYGRYWHTSTLLPNGKVFVAGTDLSNSGRSISELYDPATGTFTNTGTLTYARDYHTSTLLPNGKVFVAGTVFASNSGQSIAELYDPATGTFTITGTLTYARNRHTSTLLPSGKVLLAGSAISNSGQSISELYDPATGTFTITGTLTYAKDYHTSTLLPNGKALLAGTALGNSGRSISELYDPATGTFTNTGTLTYARYGYTSTLLLNGKALLAGTGAGNSGQSISELYDPATGTFTITGTTTYARYTHTSSLLGNGKVLLAGTAVSNSGQSISELYDPASGTFTITGTMTYVRSYNTSTLLGSGKVLLAGTSAANSGQSISELYDPVTYDIYAQKTNSSGVEQWTAGGIRVNSDDGNRTSSSPNYDHLNPKVKLDTSGNAIVAWQETRNSAYGDDIYGQKLQGTDGAKLWPAGTTGTFGITGTMTYARATYSSTVLGNGKVLLAGTNATNSGQSITELYDPVGTGTFTITGTMTYARSGHTSTLLGNGKVLLAGTSADNSGQSIAELYDPGTGTFTTTGTSAYARKVHTSTLLPNGKVLVAGTSAANDGRSITELYDPSTGTFTITGTSTYDRVLHTSTLLSSGKVLVAGTNAANSGRSISELYDPGTGTFTITGTSTYDRVVHTSTLLPSGKVLLAGTNAANSGQSISELYDPGTGTFTITGTMTYARNYHISTLLGSGKVLLAGTAFGSNSGQSISELYDPGTGTFTITGTTTYARDYHTSTLLGSGKVLLAGTAFGSNSGRSIAELYTPAMDIEVSNDGSAGNWLGYNNPYYPERKGLVGRQTNPVLTIDSGNNAIIAWEDDRFSQISQNLVSFNYDSNAWWGTNINIAAAGVGNGGGGTNNSDGAIPAILGPPVRIMGQKLSSSTGAKNWGDDQAAYNQNNPEDLILSATGDTNTNPELAANGTDVVMAWDSNGATKNENGSLKRESNIYSQKFDQNGKPYWGQTFAITGTTTYSRKYFTSTLLPNGKVLVAGTLLTNSGRSIAELYDPGTGTFTITGILTYGRYNHTTTLLGNGKTLIVGTDITSNSGRSIAELYDPAIGTFNITGTLTYQREEHTSTLLSNGSVLIIGTGTGGAGLSIAELFNPSTGTFTITGTSTYSRKEHTSTLLPNGKVLVAGTSVVSNSGQSIAELYDPATSTFTITGTMTYARTDHTSTLLSSGKVLMIGTPVASNDGQSISELYDPGTGTFTISGTTTYARSFHTSTLVANSKILLIGTFGNNSGNSISELYDPATGAFTISGTTTYEREYHQATLLGNGKILITGTNAANSGQSIAELYSVDQMVNSGVDLADQSQPQVEVSGSNLFFAWQGIRGSDSGGGGSNIGGAERGGLHYAIFGQKTDNPSAGTLTNSWPDATGHARDAYINSGTTTYARNRHTSTLLGSGRALLTGTFLSNDGQSISELYDPSAGTFTTTGTVTYARYNHTATLLGNGKVLLAGTNAANSGQSIAELYDPATGTFTITGTMSYARTWFNSTLLGNGKVLLTGANFSNSGRSIAELYDPGAGTFTITGTMTYARNFQTSILLGNGKVLVSGTYYSNSGQSISELYDSATGAFTIAGTTTYARSSHTTTLLSNGKVLMVGTIETNAGRSIAELYDPGVGTFTIAGTMTYARYSHTSTLLGSGKVLVSGTVDANSGQSISELYNPAAGTFTITGTMTYIRYRQTSTLLPNGKVLVSGTVDANSGQSISELYNPSGEMLMSHNYGLAGDQTQPNLVVNSGNPIVTWQDNRSALVTDVSQITSDWNIFMQKFDGSTGSPQWPAASDPVGYSSPYAVTDIRVDTIGGAVGTHYSGKPVIGGIDSSSNIYFAWDDNRSDTNAASGECGYSNTSSMLRICSQKYSVSDQTTLQTVNWYVKFFASAATTPNISINVDITEWDGVQEAKPSNAQSWTACDPACGSPAMQTVTFTSGNPTTGPPSDTVGNITMRRLRVRFTRNSGSVTVSYDNTGVESRLDVAAPGTQDSVDSDVDADITKNLSAVVDASFVVHLLYIKNDTTDYVAYKKRTGTTWDVSPTNLDASNTNAYVSLSYQLSDDDLYAVWIDTSNSYIYYDQWNGSSWTHPAGGNPWKNTGTNTNITTNFSGNPIFAMWTVGGTSPYTISADIIYVPESLGVFLMLGPLLLGFLRKKRRQLFNIKVDK